MAQTVPYLIPLTITLVASASGTMTYTVAPNEEIHIRQWRWTSTSTFIVYDIRTTGQVRLTNASQSVGILSTHLQNPGNGFFGILDLLYDWVIPQTYTLYLDVKDTSGAGNTLNVTLLGTRIF